MAYLYKQIKYKFFNLFPIIMLFFISLNGNSIINMNFFSLNIHYILVYYWVLKRPEVLSYGFIFLSGVITDVVFGIPIGANSLTLMAIAAVATYVRLVTVKVSLISDWISFVVALLVANFVYFSALYFSNYPIEYFYMFKNSLFTFFFYPVLWLIFGLLFNLTKSSSNA